MRIVNNTEFATRADVVVVGGHEGFDYRELRIATQAVLRGAELIGVTRDRTFPMPDGPWPGSGASSPRSRRRPGSARSARSASRSRTCTPPRATGSATGATSPSATGSTSTSRARAARGIDSALVLTGGDRARRGRRRRARSRRTWPTRSARWCWADPASVLAPHGPAPLCLIVNPSAGGGRAARLLPARRGGAARARASRFRVERTHSLEHARELARAALAAGEVAAAMGGDGLIGAVAGELRGTDGVLGVLPGGRGNDFARKLGIGPDPEQACDVLAAGRERLIDVAEAGGRTYLGIASAGFDSDVQDIANATRSRSAGWSTSTRRCARCAAGATRAGRSPSTARRTSFDGYSVAVANSGVFGGGMYLVPDASLDDGLLDVVLAARGAEAELPRRACPKVFKGTHVDEPGPDVPARRARSRSTPTARSPPTPTATRSPTCPSPSGSCRARCKVLVP